MGTCRQCGSWSVAGHHHRKVIGRDPICAIVSTTWALTCLETVHQRPCMTREIETWLSDSRVGNNSVVGHKSRRPVLSSLRNLSILSDHTVRRDASHAGGCSKTSAYTGQFGWASMIWSSWPVPIKFCRSQLLSTGWRRVDRFLFCYIFSFLGIIVCWLWQLVTRQRFHLNRGYFRTLIGSQYFQVHWYRRYAVSTIDSAGYRILVPFDFGSRWRNY